MEAHECHDERAWAKVSEREQLAGYFLIEARNLDEAIDVAGRVPGARWGTVEVRPVKEVAGLPGD